MVRPILAACLVAGSLTLAARPIVEVVAFGRATQPGEVLRLDVSGLAPAAAGRVRVFDRAFPLFSREPGGHVAMVGIDLDVRPGAHTAQVEVVDTTGRAEVVATKLLTVRAKAFPTRRLTVEPRFVEPPPAEQARIAEEARRLAEIWELRDPVRWTNGFIAPVPDRATSAFGSRSIFNGQARSPHGGADFSSPVGRPIVAPAAGRVVLVGDLYFTGQTVVIDHGMGLVSLFAHLSEFGVTDGQSVERGDRIGLVGATGRVTGPHLHWTVRLAGARVDPLSLIAATADRR